MSSLLHIASHIQAAVKAYNSVKEHADREKWKAGFENEKSNSILAFREAKAANPSNQAPALHPLIVALGIVLEDDEDFSLITENHPNMTMHKFYDESAVFPPLSAFIPSRENCWWEDLAAQSRFGQAPLSQKPQNSTTHEEQVAVVGLAVSKSAVPKTSTAPKGLAAPKGSAARKDSTALTNSVPPKSPAALDGKSKPEKRAVRAPKLKILPPKEDKLTRPDDAQTALDEPPKSRRKRKAVEVVVPQKSFKRPAPASPTQDSENSDSDGSNWMPPFSITFECDRCLEKGIKCEPHPKNACKRCHDHKVGCTLVPQNAATGKANRQKLTRKSVFEYRLEQRNSKPKPRLAVQKGKGKKPVRSKQDDPQPGASGSGPSPSNSLGRSTGLRLNSPSSKGDSPVPDPAPVSAHVPANVPSARRRSRGNRQPSPMALSLSSDDDRSITARLTALEAGMKQLREFVMNQR